MRRTLLLIPHEIASIPVFGIGLVLGLLIAAAAVVTMTVIARKQNVTEYWLSNGLIWLLGAAAVVFLIPNIELTAPDGSPVGMAIRGYGVMLLAGVAVSVWLAIVRGKRYGIDPDTMLGVAPWVLVGGILGARLFYVVEYRDQFFMGGVVSTIKSLVNFTEGGLVVYGSFIGGFLAAMVYILRHSLPFLRMGDAIVPCMFIGLSLGRIGCLMNGCCYGNTCEDHWSALRFPNGSPVFQEQISSGKLLGLTLSERGDKIIAVAENSPAAARGIVPGGGVESLDSFRSLQEADPKKPVEDAPIGAVAVIDGKEHYWSASQLPLTASPVRASQLISSIGALALCGMLCFISRYLHRDGWVMLIGFASYTVLRFVMEILRNDEPGQFGTELTIAQWVSVVVFALSLIGMAWLKWGTSAPKPVRNVEAAGG